MTSLREIIAGARRRHVFRVIGVYAAAAFVLLQLTDILLPAFGLSEPAITYLLMAIATGFPVVLVVTLMVDITPDRIQITPGMTPGEHALLRPARVADMAIIVVALGVGYLYLERFLADDVALDSASASVHPLSPDTLPSAQNASRETSSQDSSEQTDQRDQPDKRAPSIAVLPFDNLSLSAENAILSGGIQEDILNQLSQNPELIVTSGKSTRGYAESDLPIRQIASELGVNYIMEGSVRRAGHRVRITVQLIDAIADQHIWSRTYDHEMIDVFSVEDEVARQVAETLKVQFQLLEADRPTDNLAAYLLFLEARELAAGQGTGHAELAVTRYREALALDPDFADAWAGIALAFKARQGVTEYRDESRHAAGKALAIAPDSWLANWAMASYLSCLCNEQYQKALPYYRRAIEVNPNDANVRVYYGFSLWQLGQTSLAGEQFRQAYRRNPLSAEANLARASAAQFDGNPPLAERHIRTALALESDQVMLQWWAGQAYLDIGRPVEAARHLVKALELDPKFAPAMFTLYVLFRNLDALEAADYWTLRSGKIDPGSTRYLAYRSELLTNQKRIAELESLVRGWIERDPENAQARRYMGYLPTHLAVQAYDDEDMEGWFRYRREALQSQMDYLRGTSPDGEPTVTISNSFSFLSSMVSAKVLGETDLMRQQYVKLLAFDNSQPPGGRGISLFQVGVAHALMGHQEEAIHAFNTLYDSGGSFISGLRNYRMLGDKYLLYEGIDRNVGFMDLMDRMQSRNREILSEIRQIAPASFPPDGFERGTAAGSPVRSG